MTEFLARVNYWKMAILRVMVFALVSGAGFCLSHTETWSDATWHETGWFTIGRIALGAGMEMGMIIVAFLDQTMARLRNDAPPAKHPDA